MKGLLAAGTAVAVLMGGGVITLGSQSPAFKQCAVTQLDGGTALGAAIDPNSLPASVGVWKRDQVAIAALVVNEGVRRGLDEWTIQLAVAVAMKESSLRNLNHGDAVRNDTIGVFQIGPEHGSYANRMDPTWSAGNFYQRLLAVRNYRTINPPSLAAHRAQRNADPDAYTVMWDDAADMLRALRSTPPAPGATPDPGAEPARGSELATTTRTYKLGPNVRPVTASVANAVGSMFGIKTVGGWRPGSSERYDQEGHPAGLALDFMTNDIPDGDAVGNQMADYLIANAESVGVKYIIWRQRSWTAARGWRAMADRGSPTQNHMDHVHLSLRADAQGVTPGGGGGAGGRDPDCTPADGLVASGPVSAGGWAQPIAVKPGQRSFGMRRHPVYGTMKMHEGQDFGSPCGTPIFAAADGLVTFAAKRGGYGHLIILDHGVDATGAQVTSRYGHMYSNGLLVSVGERVTAGQKIALVGSDGTSTACHLHFEIRANGSPVEPVDYLRTHGVGWG